MQWLENVRNRFKFLGVSKAHATLKRINRMSVWVHLSDIPRLRIALQEITKNAGVKISDNGLLVADNFNRKEWMFLSNNFILSNPGLSLHLETKDDGIICRVNNIHKTSLYFGNDIVGYSRFIGQGFKPDVEFD